MPLVCEEVCSIVEVVLTLRVAWFRVDKTLRNLKEFREAYDCHAGDKMVNEKPCVVYGAQ